MELDDATLERYARQVLVEEIGYEGQCLILQSTLSIGGQESPWRSLLVRYVRAFGFQVVVSDLSQPHLVVEGGQYQDVIELATEPGLIMMEMGRILTRLALRAAQGALVGGKGREA